MLPERSPWNTPPHGDFVAYVERLTAESAARAAAVAHRASAVAPAPAAPAPAPAAPQRKTASRTRLMSTQPRADRVAVAQALQRNPAVFAALLKVVRWARRGALGMTVLLGVLWWWNGGVPLAGGAFLAIWWSLGRALRWLGDVAPQAAPPTSAPAAPKARPARS
ncbi:MAG: hypothetical protein ACK40S_03145 [Burkholderiaceae bacterium]